MAHAYHNHLTSVPLFADLDESELDAVAAITTELSFSAGTALMNEGAGAHEMVVVVDGTLEVTRAGDHIADIGPGGFAGEMAVLTHARRDATVTAKSDVKALHLDGRAFVTSSSRFHQLPPRCCPSLLLALSKTARTTSTERQPPTMVFARANATT